MICCVCMHSKAPYLHAFTYHKYGGGGSTDVRTYATYGSGDLSGISIATVKQHAPKAEVWVGEGGGQGCSEGSTTRQVRSNTAIDMFWWLDALGNTAVHGACVISNCQSSHFYCCGWVHCGLQPSTSVDCNHPHINLC